MAQWIYTVVLSAVLLGCATGKCVNANSANAAAAAGATTPATATVAANSGGTAMKPESKLDRVKVYKPDGSLQCGQGKAVPVADMQKDLKDIKVFSSFNKNDGMMRIQVCGSPTGNSNVYEIERKNLEAAVKLGFKEWTYDN